MTKSTTACVAAAVFAATLGGSALANGDRGRAADIKASAEIYDCSDGRYLGRAALRERPSDEGIKEVTVALWVKGLTPGKHAVHLHETGECIPCGAAAGHFDPGPAGFSAPDGNHPYHSGDLVNVEVNRHGVGHLSARTTRVTLSPGPLSLFDDDGSAIVIHVNPDTYCPGGEVAGCAGGGRAACGLIMPD